MSNTTLPEIDLLVIGHIAADVIPGGFQLGGTAAYAAAAAKPFGLRIGVLTSSRVDEPLLADLQEYAHVINIPAEKTTTFENIYTSQGRVQYWLKQAGRLRAEHIPSEWRSTRLVHVGPLADEVDNDIINDFGPESYVMVTPQGWMRQRAPDNQVLFKPWFDAEMLRRANMVVISEEDIAAAPDLRQEYAAATELLVITDGEKGGLYYVNSERREYDAVPLTINDLTGAGDVFATAAFVAWDRCNHDPDAAMAVGAYLAACSISRSGLDSAPTPDEIETAFALVKDDQPD
jgi:sugar/nucleoside kinase (ribokinase family)